MSQSMYFREFLFFCFYLSIILLISKAASARVVLPLGAKMVSDLPFNMFDELSDAMLGAAYEEIKFLSANLASISVLLPGKGLLMTFKVLVIITATSSLVMGLLG
jgi:hypothetical protein